MVTRQQGKVELRRARSGAWEPLEVGASVAEEDAVRTGPDSSLELTASQMNLRVFERSDLKIRSLAEGSVRARMSGHVEADVPEGQAELALETEGSDAQVTSGGGRVMLTSDARGVVAVAVVRGKVKLSAGGRSVEVRQGQVSQVKPGRSPEPPRDAFTRVLLSVNWPEPLTNREWVDVTGRVEVGSRVVVQGHAARVAPDGSFAVEVPLRVGSQTLEVKVVDVLGREKRAKARVKLDRTAPDVKKVRPLWSP